MASPHEKSTQDPPDQKQTVGPITGLKVLYGRHAQAPPKYTVIPVDLNSGTGGDYIYLAYSRDKSEGLPITAIQVAASSTRDDPKCTPPGYKRVEGDLCKGMGLKYVYVSYITRTSYESVCDICILVGDHHLIWPKKEYVRVDQDCNEGAGGKYIYIAYM